jgi:hypothetical protein
LPVDEAHTDASAEMAASGSGLINTRYLPEETAHCPLALVTVTDKVTIPDAPAV